MRQIVIKTGIGDFPRSSINDDNGMLNVVARIPMFRVRKGRPPILIEDQVPIGPARCARLHFVGDLQPPELTIVEIGARCHGALASPISK